VLFEFGVVVMSVLYFYCSSELILLHNVFNVGKDVLGCENSVTGCPSEIRFFLFFLIPCSCAFLIAVMYFQAHYGMCLPVT